MLTPARIVEQASQNKAFWLKHSQQRHAVSTGDSPAVLVHQVAHPWALGSTALSTSSYGFELEMVKGR